MIQTTSTERIADRPIPRILVVDDDLELCELLAEYLQPEGFDVDAVYDGVQGVDRALQGNYSLLILDVMLPGIRGFEVLRQIRAKSAMPIIMLTARDEDIDRILGLEIGADDYLAKPFNPRELAARIQAVLRRSSAPAREAEPEGPRQITLSDIELDESARTVRRGHREIDLTSVEFDLLAFFMKNPVKVLEREEIVKQILGRDSAPEDRSIDVHVSNLRKKLGKAADGSDRIRAVRGIGYIFVVPVKTKSR
ncbi:MAG TPA: response regulator transcription factor [Candidatus Acidoferrales bacterium]